MVTPTATKTLAPILPEEPEKRRKIIRAARELFAQKRYDDVTVPEIVKAAGVAQGTFYRYFESKTKLVEAIAEDMQRDVTHTVQSIVAKDKPITEMIEPLLRGVLETLSSYRDMLPFLNTDALLFGDSREAEKRREPYVDTITQLIERDQKKGLLSRKFNALFTARLLDGVVVSVVQDCVLQRANLPTEPYVAEAIAFLKRALKA
ncbi:MAG: TetR/AcrR family transcriptional regulator [Trueperaceae bacterium]